MTFFKFITPLIYWILIALWSFILIFYVQRLQNFLIKGRLLFILLLILSIDAFRTLFESLYFGAWYTSLAGFLPITVHSFLIRPEMVFFPKILNVISAMVIIVILLYRWLPQEAQEKERLEKIIADRTIELKTSNEKLVKEIKHRTQAEQRVKKYADNLETIFNSTPNILILVNKERKVKIINDKGADYLKKDKEKLVGLLGGKVLDCLNALGSGGCGHTPECSACSIDTRVTNTFKTARGHTEEKGQMTLLQNGKETQVDFLISTSLLELDGIEHVLLSLTDNTENSRSEKVLWDSNQRFHKVFHSHLDAIFVLNNERDARIVEINNAATKIFGYHDHELIGQTTEKLHLDKAHLNLFQKELYAAIETHDYLTGFEFSMKRKDKTIFPSEHNVVELKNDQNERTGWVSIVKDLTQRKQTEERLQQSQRMEAIGNLAGGIAHDFNNILFPIMGMSELLLEDLPGDEPEHEKVKDILTAGKRGSELVKQILAFSRQTKHEMVPVKVQQILREVLKLSRSTIPIDIEIIQKIQQDCSDIWGDPTQIHQIAMNLITNAYHAIENNENDKKITVLLNQIPNIIDKVEEIDLSGNGYIHLSVADNGIGIKQEVMGKLFEPYFTTKGEGKGTGLGLAVVYGIIKEHGGKIVVHSEENGGSVFNVYLPLMPQNNNFITDVGPQSHAIIGGTERILLVDDEKAITRLVQQILQRLGYKVVAHTSSMEALGVFKNNPDDFDLVISDLSMPYMTGEKLTKEILKIRPDIPVIICTGFSEELNEALIRKSGVKGFLMKPVVKSKLARTVRKLLDKK